MAVRQLTNVPARFDELVGALAELGSPIGRYLRPGRSPDEIEGAARSLGLAAPAELVDWFGRHDGPDDDGLRTVDPQASPLELFPMVRPLALAESVSLCLDMRDSAEGLGEEGDRFWHADWLPILFGSNSIFAVESPGAADGARVWRALSHPGLSETGPVAESLAAFLERWIGEIRAGSIYWHPDYRSLEPRDNEVAIRLDASGLY
jgi:cell wall assembly regulator SMI1